MVDNIARSALARGLHARIHEFESCGDELRVLDAVAARLALGRQRHGVLDLAKSRDWVREMDEELIDWLVYHACKRLSDRDAQVAAIAARPDDFDVSDVSNTAELGGEG